MKKYLN